MIIDEIRTLKEQSRMTNQQISEKSGVPLQTVNRILAGQTDNPCYSTVRDMVKAMGGSLDTLEKAKSGSADTPSSNTELVAHLNKQIKQQSGWIKGLFFTLVGVISVLLIVLIIDAFNGSWGWVRY